MTDGDLSGFFKNADWHMADIAAKEPTRRRALATGGLRAGPVAFPRIVNGGLPKGDALKLAEVAGIVGAKNAWQTLALAHPLPLEHIAVKLEPDSASQAIRVFCLVSALAKTGVEMEALAGVQAAVLTLYDLTKPVEPALTMLETRLVFKEGGKKGDWYHPDGAAPGLTITEAPVERADIQPLAGVDAAVLTLSDRGAAGVYPDRSGPAAVQALAALGARVRPPHVLPDDREKLRNALETLTGNLRLIVTTGGTGLGPRDITCDVVRTLPQARPVPGLGELLRASGARSTSRAWLSGALAVVYKNTLIVALPGSVGAVSEGLAVLAPVLPHALDMIAGRPHPPPGPAKGAAP